MAGGELSSIGSRHSEKVSGLIYLDAGYAYAYYVAGGALPPMLTPYLDARDLRQSIDALTDVPGMRHRDIRPVVAALLQKSLPDLQKDLAVAQIELKLLPPQPSADTVAAKVSDAILAGTRKYSAVK